jgi:hypothetical protein
MNRQSSIINRQWMRAAHRLPPRRSVKLLVMNVGGARSLRCGFRSEPDPLAHPDVRQAAAPNIRRHEKPVHPAIVADKAKASLGLESGDVPVRHD